MPWHDDGAAVPERSEAELLQVVRTKAAAIRHRRLQTVTGAVAGLVVVVGCLVVAIRQGDDGATNITMASPSTTSAAPASGDAFSAVPIPEAPPETTSPAPAPLPSATGDSPSAAAPSRPPGDATAAPPAASQGSSAAGAPVPPAPGSEPAPVCSPSEIPVTAVTDRSTYSVGSDVKITVTARNQSARPCARPTSFEFQITDAAGAPVMGGAGHGDYVTPPPPMQPGETITENATWGHTTICDDTCHPAPPGSYRVTASIGDYAAGPVPFTISG